MDGQRFDELTKVFATATSRRSMLRALAGSALGGLGLFVRPGGAAGQACRGPGRLCTKDANCCSMRCDPATRQCVCPAGQGACRGECVDPASYLTNAKHCGACGRVCAVPNATAACSDGRCVVGACRTGFRDCNGDPVDGCETNIATNPDSCGACGYRCADHAGPNQVVVGCTGGVCGYACVAGFRDCNNDPADGCEVDVNTDPDHCGGCGAACSANNMATRTCTGGVCDGGCAEGFADCNGDKRSDGCETELGTVDNCAECGDSCDSGNPCTADSCFQGECAQTNVEGACDGGTCAEGTCCLGRLEGRRECSPGGEICCEDEPCCPTSSGGPCCLDCFREVTESGEDVFCCEAHGRALCPPSDRANGFCCDAGEVCVVNETETRCVRQELACDGGVICPEPCCQLAGGARVCCASDEYCYQGACRPWSVDRSCTEDTDCEAGERCAGVSVEFVPPQGPDGEPQLIEHPGTCCPQQRYTSLPNPNLEGVHSDCCGYGSRGNPPPDICCSYPQALECSDCNGCSTFSARSRF